MLKKILHSIGLAKARIVILGNKPTALPLSRLVYFLKNLRLKKIYWHSMVIMVLFVSLITGIGPVDFVKLVVRAFEGREQKTVNFYATNCTMAIPDATSTGWQNITALTGRPETGPDSKLSHDQQNSAYFLSGTSTVVCSGFNLFKPLPTVSTTSLEQIIVATSSVATNTNDIIIGESVASSTDASSTSAEASSTLDQATSSIVEEPASSTGQVLVVPAPEASSADVMIVPLPLNGVDGSQNSSPIARLANYFSNTFSFAQNTAFDYYANLKQSAVAEHAEVLPARFEDLGYFKSARINFSLAELKLATATIENLASSSTPAASTTDQTAASTTPEQSGMATTTDASSSLLATYNDSAVAAPTEALTDGKVTIWYSIKDTESSSADGRLWWKLTSLPISGELNCNIFTASSSCLVEALKNQASAGQFSFKAPMLRRWTDLSNLQVKVEASSGGSLATVYFDSVWASVNYTADEDDSNDGGYDPVDQLVVGDQVINFPYTDDTQDENLLIRANSQDYVDITNATVFFSVTNQSEQAEHVNLQVHFPEEMGSVYKLERLRHGRWTSVSVNNQPISEPNVLQKFFGRGEYKRKPIREGMRAKNSTNDGGILINPGMAQYYRMVIQYPAMTKGEFYIEAEGDGAGYGLLDPWWDGYWHYKMPITVTNPNPIALTDYQFLLEISSTTANFWNHLSSASGTDIRFTDSTETSQLSFWTQYFNKAASSTQIWVKVPSIPANSTTTVYMYYGNTLATTSPSDMYSTFTYSSMQDLYYVVTNYLPTATVTVVSLIDNNQVQLDGQTVANLNRQQIANFKPVASTSVLRAMGPVLARVTGASSSDALLPISFAGTQFAIPSNRNIENFYQYSPFTKATSSLYSTTTLRATTVLGTSTASTTVYNAATSSIIEATKPILVAFNTSAPSDSLSLYPTTNRDLYGVRSNNNYIGVASSSTNFTIYCSNAATLAVTNQTRGTQYVNATCPGTAQGSSTAVRLAGINYPISAIQQDDGDGNESSVFLPDIEFSSEYMVPTKAQYISVACAPKWATVNLAVYDQNNIFVSSTTCAAAGNNPGRAYFGTTTNNVMYQNGSRIVSTDNPPKPFFAYYEDMSEPGTATSGLESNLWGAVQGRKQASSSPTYAIGAEQSYVMNISGTVLRRDRLTPVLTAPPVRLVYGNVPIATVTASVVDGTYSFSGIVAPATGTTTLVYLATTSMSGASYNSYAGSGDITGFDIYQNGVVVRHDDAGPMTNAKIGVFAATQDNKIKVTFATPNITFGQGQFLYVWPGDTYVTGGTLTTSKGTSSVQAADIIIGASSTLNVAANAVTAAGGWYNSGSYITTGAQTTTFTATSTGYFINNVSTSTFYNLTLNGTAGGWTANGVTDVNSAFTFTAGTLIMGTSSDLIVDGATALTGTLNGKGDVTAYGNVTGNGVVYMNGGTFTMASTSNLAGTVARTFYNLTFGDGRATVATTTRSVSTGAITVLNDLTINPNQYFAAGSATYNLNGTGTPFILLGSLVQQTSLFRYAGTSSPVMVTPTRYYNLQLAPSTAGGQQYSIATGSVYMNGYMTIGDGVNAADVTASTSNPLIDVAGNFTISANATFTAPTSSSFTIAGNWANTGRFVHASGTVTFDATTTAHTIAPGVASPFNNIYFNGFGGGWTVNANATSTGNWTLATGTSFALSAGATMWIQGSFWNNLLNASTTWTGSTVYLNGNGVQTINSKTNGGDSYATLRIGSTSDVRMWDSTSTVYSVATSGSLYSMDASTTPGSLWIWNSFDIATGTTEYWQNTVDFDGADLSATPRQVNVRVASSSTVSLSGGALNIVGSSTATTTIAGQQATGTFATNIGAGTFNAKYYQLRNLGFNGLNMFGAPIVQSLDYGDYMMSVASGSMISLTPSVINNNPGFMIYGCRFATSSTVSTGYNVFLSASSSGEWDFNGLLGNRAGEAYDSDPSDPRGNIVWDDSPSYVPKSQDWIWYNDETNETPTATAAPMNVAPSSVPAASELKLRWDIKETSGLSANDVKVRLQYSTSPTFASNVNFVGEIGSTTALWTYANGVDNDGDNISTMLLASSTIAATHNESGTTTSTFNDPANSVAEFEFTIMNNGAAVGTTYYFRAYSLKATGSVISVNTGYAYPSIVPGNAAIASAITGLNSGTTTCGITTNLSAASSSINFGNLAFATQYYGAHRLSVTTNAESGYQVFLIENKDLTKNDGATITGVPATNDNPQPWSIGTNPGGFGYHTSDATLSGASPSRFAANNTYARIETTMREIGYNPLPSVNDTIDLVYRLEITNQQPSGDFNSAIEYIITPTY